MGGLIYVDQLPAIDRHNGMVTIDLRSGDEIISLIVTRHVAGALGRRIACEMLCLERDDGNVTPMRRPSVAKKRKARP